MGIQKYQCHVFFYFFLNSKSPSFSINTVKYILNNFTQKKVFYIAFTLPTQVFCN